MREKAICFQGLLLFCLFDEILIRPFPQKGQRNRELRRRTLQEHLHKTGGEVHESPSWRTRWGHSLFPAVVSEAPIYIMLLSKELYVSSAPPSILRASVNRTLKHLSVAPQWGQRVKHFWVCLVCLYRHGHLAFIINLKSILIYISNKGKENIFTA